jgi:peptidoglycan/LPS O-acetylase OafA/YrhL
MALAFRFGQEAVIAFFLLSGFLIYANEQARVANDLRGYAARRIGRIYPPLLAAMVVSLILSLFLPELWAAIRWNQMLGTLVGLQDVSAIKPGVITDSFMGNTPLWSLSYELAFYALFPLAMAVERRWGSPVDHAVGLVSLAAYGVYIVKPGHFALILSYFSVWWIGAAIARAYRAGFGDLRAIAVPLVWLAALLGLAIVNVATHAPTASGVYPMLMVRHFGCAWVAAIVLFSPVGRWILSGLSAFPRIFAGLAGVSYGVYVLHYPLLIHAGAHGGLAGLIGGAVATLVLAWLVERWRPFGRSALAVKGNQLKEPADPPQPVVAASFRT